MHLRLPCWLLAVVFVLCAATPWPSAAQADSDAYATAIDRGLAASASGDWQRAYEAFAEAHTAAPSARALRGMGVASYRMERYAQALASLLAALSEPSRALEGELRAGVQKLVLELDARVCRIALQLTPSHGSASVDGSAGLRDEAGRLLLDPGPHVLSLRAEDFAERSVSIVCAPGQRLDVSIELAPDVPSASSKRPSARAPAPMLSPVDREARAASNRSRPWQTVGWIATAAVPVFALATGISWMETQRIGDDLAERCKREACSDDRRRDLLAESSLATAETLTTVGWVLTAAAAVTAGTAFVIDETASEPRDKNAARVDFGPLHARITVDF